MCFRRLAKPSYRFFLVFSALKRFLFHGFIVVHGKSHEHHSSSVETLSNDENTLERIDRLPTTTEASFEFGLTSGTTHSQQSLEVEDSEVNREVFDQTGMNHTYGPKEDTFKKPTPIETGSNMINKSLWFLKV